MLRPAIAAFDPWKKMMKKKEPKVNPRNYVTLYMKTLKIDRKAVCESTVRKLLTGSMTLDGPGTGRALVYHPRATEPFLEQAAKDAKEEGLTVKELFRNRGPGKKSIIRNKAIAFLGKKEYGYTFTSQKKKDQLSRFLRDHAKPYIEAALKAKVGKGTDI